MKYLDKNAGETIFVIFQGYNNVVKNRTHEIAKKNKCRNMERNVDILIYLY